MKNGLTLKKIWRNKKKIANGFINTYLKKDKAIENIASHRMSFCKNCEYKSNDCDIPGECCSICGCNLEMKTRSLESSCALEELGKKPLWDAIIKE